MIQKSHCNGFDNPASMKEVSFCHIYSINVIYRGDLHRGDLHRGDLHRGDLALEPEDREISNDTKIFQESWVMATLRLYFF